MTVMNAAPPSSTADQPVAEATTAPRLGPWSSGYVERVLIFALTALLAVGLDLWTKAQPHDVVLHHYSAAAPAKLVALGLCLLAFAVYRTSISSVAAGLYFGALCGNGGELVAHGYATDWIVVDVRPFTQYALVTNIADLCVALGLATLAIDFYLTARRRRQAGSGPLTIRVAMLFAALCGGVTAAVTHDVSIGLIVAILIDMEARVIVWMSRRSRTGIAQSN